MSIYDKCANGNDEAWQKIIDSYDALLRQYCLEFIEMDGKWADRKQIWKALRKETELKGGEVLKEKLRFWKKSINNNLNLL